MAISDYKPIDDQTANPNGSYAQADLPFSAGLANRHAKPAEKGRSAWA